MVRLYTENQLSSLPGSASKVCVGGGWWVVVVVVVESKSSDRLWQSFSLALAKPNNNNVVYPILTSAFYKGKYCKPNQDRSGRKSCLWKMSPEKHKLVRGKEDCFEMNKISN